jgi:hypothetical protein
MAHVTGRSSLGPGAINVSEGVEPSSASRWRQVISPRRLDRESTGLRLVYSPSMLRGIANPAEITAAILGRRSHEIFTIQPAASKPPERSGINAQPGVGDGSAARR